MAGSGKPGPNKGYTQEFKLIELELYCKRCGCKYKKLSTVSLNRNLIGQPNKRCKDCVREINITKFKMYLIRETTKAIAKGKCGTCWKNPICYERTKTNKCSVCLDKNKLLRRKNYYKKKYEEERKFRRQFYLWCKTP